MNTGSLGLLVEACKTCDDSYSASEEEEEENDGGVLYCKARGMPFDHVDSKAILNFDEGQYKVHGADLKCSYHLCRADGIKFRWCAICNKAVAKRNFRKRHAHPGSEVQHLCPPANKVKKRRRAISDGSKNKAQWKSIKEEEETEPSIPKDVRNESYSSNHSHVTSQHDCTWSQCNTMSMPGLENDPLHCELNPSKVPIPQTWIDLFHSRPVGGSKEDVKHWLIQAMFVAGLSDENKRNDESTCTQLQSNPVVATREEFSGAIPPRFINYTRFDEKDGHVAKYRQHADTLSLQINTELDATSNSILLDSEGSIHITPRISF